MITFSQKYLRQALAGLRVLKAWKNPLAGLRCVLITGAGDTVTVSATNLDEFLSFEGRGSCPVATEVLVPYDLLVDAVKAADTDSDITVNPGSDLSYVTGGARLTVPLPAHDVADFAPIPVASGAAITLPAGVLGSMVEAQGCASSDGSRYILNSVFLSGHAVAATDGRQLYVRNGLDLAMPEGGAIFPVSGVPAVLHGDQPASLWVWDLDQTPKAMVVQGPWRWTTKLIVGNYPNFRQVIPRGDDYGTVVKIADADATRLISVLPRLPGFKESSSPVVLNVTATGAELSPPARLPQVKVALDRSEVHGASALVIQFNASFLVAALKRGFRELRVRDHVSPLVMRDASRVNLWMPVRIDVPVPSAPAEPEALPEPVQSNETNVSQPQPETSTMVAMKNTTPEIAPVVAPTEPAARIEAPVNAPSEASPLDTLQRAKDLLRELNTALTDVSTALRDLTREKRGVERDLESLKRNLRVLKAVEV
jgi:DNA polymerase III sliding clamp (beta) subunit (PCNA family)